MADDPPTESPDEDLISMVRSGRRLVMVPYVFSVLILSFKRSMGHVHVVGEGEWPMKQVWAAAFVTVFFGWIAMPMGMIWSVLALYHLWHGGKDITLELLSHSVGPEELKQIIATSPKPRPPASIWLVRLLILVPMAVISLFVFCILFPPPWI